MCTLHTTVCIVLYSVRLHPAIYVHVHVYSSACVYAAGLATDDTSLGILDLDNMQGIYMYIRVCACTVYSMCILWLSLPS